MRTVTGALRRKARLLAAALLFACLAVAALLRSAGFLDRDAVRLFAPKGQRAEVAAVLFSGDMGLRYGMGPSVARALAAHGIEVVGISSPTLFSLHRSRAEVDQIVADTVRRALAGTREPRLVLIGQSFGADVLQTGLAHLPEELRARVAAVILVVPGANVFFRADPTGLAYRGKPDSLGAATINRISWAPLTCIYGLAERDSACPAVEIAGARVIGMPGGHLLRNDRRALAGQVLAAIERAVPGTHLSPRTRPS